MKLRIRIGGVIDGVVVRDDPLPLKRVNELLDLHRLHVCSHRDGRNAAFKCFCLIVNIELKYLEVINRLNEPHCIVA